MKWKKDWEKKPWVSLTIAICIGVVLFLVLSNLPQIFSYIGKFLDFFRSVILGVVFAYVLNPLVKIFEFRILKKAIKKDRTRHFVSLTITVILVLVLLVLLGFFLVPQIVDSVGMFIGNLDTYIASAESALDKVTAFFAGYDLDISNFITGIESFFYGLQSILPSSINGILSLIGSIGSNILDFLIAAVLAIYFLADKDRLVHGIGKILKALMKPETYKKVTEFLTRGNNILISYVVFDLLEALFVGLANGIFMAIAGMPYTVLISVVVGITNLAPTFGPIVGGAIGVFFLFLVRPLYAIQFLIFTIILQIFDGYVLKPRLFSGALGVPGVMILICIVVGGKMFGIWGILLAIPFAAIVYYWLRESVGTRLEKKKEERYSQKVKDDVS